MNASQKSDLKTNGQVLADYDYRSNSNGIELATLEIEPKTNGTAIKVAVKNGYWVYSKTDLEYILMKVNQEIKELQEVIALNMSSLTEKDDGSNGIEDFGIARGTTSTDIANATIYAHSLRRVKELGWVAERISNGTYSSICVKCGETIALARLRFVPETNCCQHCARK